MTEACAKSPETTRPARGGAQGIVRERFDHEKDVVIEHALGKAESWAKKVGTGQSGVLLDDLHALLDVLGLKAVDKSRVCVDRSVFVGYRAIVIAAMTDPKKLDWSD